MARRRPSGSLIVWCGILLCMVLGLLVAWDLKARRGMIGCGGPCHKAVPDAAGLPWAQALKAHTCGALACEGVDRLGLSRAPPVRGTRLRGRKPRSGQNQKVGALEGQ